MKKVLSYLLMAATVCGISFAALACSSDDDDDDNNGLSDVNGNVDVNNGGGGVNVVR